MIRIVRQLAFALSLPAAASAQVLNFEGIVPLSEPSKAPIGNFYNGGAGPNYGIEFSSNALAGCLRPRANCTNNGSRGGLGDPNSQYGVLFWETGPSIFLNSATGFTDGFSFFFSVPSGVANVSVWSAVNGTGMILATRSLGPTTDGRSTPGCFVTAWCPFQAEGFSFAGTARSVTFAKNIVSRQIVIDDVTFGSDIPGTVVPEPASMMLLGTGLLGIVGVAWRKRRKATSGMAI